MCTIGSIFDGSVTRTFKQCDLTDPTTFYPPQERTGRAGRYLAMTRQGRPGLWAGGNAHGLTFTAADNYTRSLPLSAGADHFASTNNCRLFNTAVTYPMNPSTYLRLERAQALLQQRPNHDGLHALLRDQYYGQTDLSICRVAQAPGQFYTQASVIFSASPDGLECEYVINANPRTGSWQTARLGLAAG